MEYINAKTMLIGKSGTAEWFGYDYTVNLYRGCSHGCIYCDSRSDCYRIDNFDTVKAKRNALEILEDELRHKRENGRVIGIGSMSDTYNPHEKDCELTRGALRLIHQYRFGVSLATKSDLVTRDIDLLGAIATHSPVNVQFTVTTAYDEQSKRLEPHAPPTSKRFAALRTLAAAGIFTGVLLTPLLPFIEDNAANVLAIVAQAAAAGAKYVYTPPQIGMTLRVNQRKYFYDRLDEIDPSLRVKYVYQYGDAYLCESPNSAMLYDALQNECQKFGLLCDMRDVVRTNRAPYEKRQISLFDL